MQMAAAIDGDQRAEHAFGHLFGMAADMIAGLPYRATASKHIQYFLLKSSPPDCHPSKFPGSK
jgi:hypothetical protein